MKHKFAAKPGMHAERKMVTGFDIKGLNEDDRTLDVVMSSNKVDRDGEIIHPRAFEKHIKTFMANPVLLWCHHSFDTPIGKVLHVDISDAKMEGKVQFRPEGESDKADDVYLAIKGGFLKTFSIGFRVLKAEQEKDANNRPIGPLEITEAELYELSVVSIPANTDAMAKEARMLQTIGAAEYASGAETIFVQPSDIDVLARAGEIAKSATQKRAKGDFVDDGLLEAIESLRLSVLSVKTGNQEEDSDEFEKGLEDLLSVFKDAD